MPLLAHAAPGLASKWIDPKIPLWVSLLCVYFLDIMSIILKIFDNNLSAILTHSFVMMIVWSVVAIILTMVITYYYDSKKNDKSIKRNFHTGLFIGFLIFSHWLLDLIGWPLTVIDPNATGIPFSLT